MRIAWVRVSGAGLVRSDRYRTLSRRKLPMEEEEVMRSDEGYDWDENESGWVGELVFTALFLLLHRTGNIQRDRCRFHITVHGGFVSGSESAM